MSNTLCSALFATWGRISQIRGHIVSQFLQMCPHIWLIRPHIWLIQILSECAPIFGLFAPIFGLFANSRNSAPMFGLFSSKFAASLFWPDGTTWYRRNSTYLGINTVHFTSQNSNQRILGISRTSPQTQLKPKQTTLCIVWIGLSARERGLRDGGGAIICCSHFSFASVIRITHSLPNPLLFFFPYSTLFLSLFCLREHALKIILPSCYHQ